MLASFVLKVFSSVFRGLAAAMFKMFVSCFLLQAMLQLLFFWTKNFSAENYQQYCSSKYVLLSSPFPSNSVKQ